MHQNGRLSNDDLRSTAGSSRTQTRQEGPKSQYERSKSYIVNSLDPGPLVQDPIGKQRFAEAISTFDAWMNTGKRTDEEIEKRSRDVVDQYRFVNLSDTVIALPQPRGTNIRRSTDPAQLETDIRAAGQRLQEDRRRGRLTPAEYELEMGTLNRWRKAQEDAAKSKGAKK